MVIVEKLKDKNEIKTIQKFLLNQIQQEYGYGYNPKFHKDIKFLKSYYMAPIKNEFFLAKIDGKLVATIGVRGYDKDFKEFNNIFHKDSTASIWRLYVDKEYRRQGIASKLVSKVIDFSKSQNYHNIYLHTHKTLDGALNFWKKQGFDVFFDTNNQYKTVHMIKNIDYLPLTLNNLNIQKFCVL